MLAVCCVLFPTLVGFCCFGGFLLVLCFPAVLRFLVVGFDVVCCFYYFGIFDLLCFVNLVILLLVWGLRCVDCGFAFTCGLM